MVSHLKKEILELELRNKIYNFVNKYAGSHLRELERKSKIPYSTLKYHLHYLVKHNLIIEKIGSKNSKYYPKTIASDDIEILGLLRQKNIRKIILFILISNKCTLRDLEEFTILSPSTVSWYLNGLTKKGIIKKTKIGKKTIYKLIYKKEQIMKILVTYKESFFDYLVDKTIEMWEFKP